MTAPKLAKLFNNGGSQAVSLPAEFRFDADELYVRRDERTGDVILSLKPAHSWADFVALREQLGSAPEDFVRERDQGSEQRDPLQRWNE
jgi:antitoxin VapB